MALLISLLLSFFCLLGSFLLQTSSSALSAFEKGYSRQQLLDLDSFVFFKRVVLRFFSHHQLEGLFFSISFTKLLSRIFFSLLGGWLFFIIWGLASFPWNLFWLVFTCVIWFALFLSMGDLFARYWGISHPQGALRACAPMGSFYLLLFFPITSLLFWLGGREFRSAYLNRVQEPIPKLREKIQEMLEEVGEREEIGAPNEQERELLSSLADFRVRIVREVMTPRINITAIPSGTSLRDAARLFDEEGFSRAPLYQENLDQILGLIMYKDIIAYLLEAEATGDRAILDQPIDQLVKPIIYIPETSHLSRVLQEFRLKQTHLAIVVDEYGGTEGLITIEDCLEEIVGDIEDEYDEEEEEMILSEEKEGWILDARMTILDIEDRFGIKIPATGEYDTIGGFAFHYAGEIPSPGFQIHQEEFDVEILQATDRSIEKVGLKVHKR